MRSPHTLRAVVLAAAFLASLVHPAAVTAQPIILGAYTGSLGTVSSQCTVPSEDGVLSLSGVITITNQTGTGFSASGSFTVDGRESEFSVSVNITGSVNAQGAVSGNITATVTAIGQGPLSNTSGTFTGAVVGNTLTFQIAGQSTDALGTCNTTGTFKGSKAPLVPGLREGWESAAFATHTPDDIVTADDGTWLLQDTVSNFPECGPSPHTAEILLQGSDRALRLTSNDSNSGCSDNVWVVRLGRSNAIGADTVFSFSETGALVDPQTASPRCIVVPCGDTISFLLQDNRGNVLAYLLQRAPGAVPNTLHTTYREIFLDPSAGGYSRDLLADFETIPAFNASGATLVSVEFKIQDHGVAVIDNLFVGPRDGFPFPHTIDIVSGPTGNPNPVPFGETVDLTVSALDSVGHALAYTWTSICPALGGDGVFSDPGVREPNWTPPVNATGRTQVCTIAVIVSDGTGLIATASFDQQVEGITIIPLLLPIILGE